MTTKESILDPHLKYAWELDQCSPVIPYSEAEKAMDEYAKQQAIAFANFIAHHNYKPHDIDTWDEGRKNTHEVYDDFIEYQRIEQQTKE